MKLQYTINFFFLFFSPISATIFHFWLFNLNYPTNKKEWLQTVGWMVLYFFLCIMMIATLAYLRGHGVNQYSSLLSNIGNIVKYGILSLLNIIALPIGVSLVYTQVTKKMAAFQRKRENFDENKQ